MSENIKVDDYLISRKCDVNHDLALYLQDNSVFPVVGLHYV